MQQKLTAAIAVACSIGFGAAAFAQGNTQPGNGQQIRPNAMQTMPATPSAALPAGQHLSRGVVKQAQRKLRSDGLYAGKIDGMAGPRTRQAIAQFQKQNGMTRTGRLDQATLAQLNGTGYGASSPPPTSTAHSMVPAGPGAGGMTKAAPPLGDNRNHRSR